MAKIAINLTTGTLQKNDIIVGIDLGTTNSLVAVLHPDTQKAIVLKEFDQAALVPSIVHFNQQQQITIGEDAKQYLVSEPQNTIFSIKRLIGKNYNDIKENANAFTYKIIDDETDKLVKIQVGNMFYNPIELSSLILKELKTRAEHILKTPVQKAVITVPAYFNDSQRQATRDAGKLAGLDVLRIINEPTAASLAYGIGLQANENKTIAVYDLGGGTFDISILKIENGIFEVLSTNGNTYLGGDDIDQKIVEHFIEQTAINKAAYFANKNLIQQYRLMAQKAKIHLSKTTFFENEIEGIKVNLSKEKLEELILPLVKKTIDCCQKALKDAELSTAEIDEILMVGGSTRIPLVKEMLSSFFNKKINDSINPDEVVALGAAIQADVLVGNNKDILLLDVTPLSLGIETMGGLMDVIIPRNSKIPTAIARQYTTHKDGQANMQISVFQGERDLVKDNRKLAELILKGIPSMPVGLPKVEISFKLNVDGILKVTAKELRSGVEQSIDVQPQYGLTDSQVEDMLQASLHHAKDDMQLRALVEATTEAEQLIFATNNFIAKHKENLSTTEIENTQKAIAILQEKISEKNKNDIQAQMEILNKTSSPYAERIMDLAIAVALKGKSI